MPDPTADRPDHHASSVPGAVRAWLARGASLTLRGVRSDHGHAASPADLARMRAAARRTGK
jgi:hypothetical protein